MPFEGLIGFWADSLSLSIGIWVVILMTLAYGARAWAHRLIHETARFTSLLARYMARAVRRATVRLRRWYLRYLRGVEARRLEGRVERVYRDIHGRVNRDLGGFPALQQRIHRHIDALEHDYHSAHDQVPEEPGWMRTANALAAAPPKADPRVGQVLEEIHDSLARSGREALEDYRRASQSRMEILKGLLPAWREVGDHIQQMERVVRGVSDQTKNLDRMVGQYRRLAQGGVPARTLTLASFGTLAVSGLVLVLLGLCAAVLFFLVVPPMEQVLGGAPGSSVAPWAVASLVLLLLLGGGMMTEARQVSRIIPAFGAMDPRGRQWVFTVGLMLVVLTVLLCATLAASRDFYVAQGDALHMLLEGEPDLLWPGVDWLSTLTRLALGGLLPLPLMLIALPLQAFMQSVAVVGVGFVLLCLSLIETLLGGFALGARLSERLLKALYELLIFPPLLMERGYRAWCRKRSTDPRESSSARMPAELLTLPEVPSGRKGPGASNHDKP